MSDAPQTPAALVHDGEIPNRQDLHDIPVERGKKIMPVIGLGGSAGAIAPLQTFFREMPDDCGMAFVVILHLMPDFESNLAAVLQHHTGLKVSQVTRRVKLEPNHVYVIAPDQQLTLDDGHINVSDLERPQGKRVAVDLFFRTLAESHGAHSVAIVMSGTDGDGAVGIKRVKEFGGVTVAQDPDEAEHDGMPRSAIQTGMVDWILPASKMAAKLIEFCKNEELIDLPAEDARKTKNQRYETALREVLAFLHARTGHDFTHYKRTTILRRLARRLQVNSLGDIPAYLEYLRTHPAESSALLQDFLISVTNFFRDAEAFARLGELVPGLFRAKTHNDQVRVWVAGCATGEEAYSLAMILSEFAANLDDAPTIQIFATDIDEEAIRDAREAIYPAAITADVSPERLRRFFVAEQGRYRIKRELRETVLFANHNLLRDSPFSRLDLVTCRNLLIYFDAVAQKRAFEIFHFALKPEGTLFLGSSDSAADAETLFSGVDNKHRLYARRAVSKAILPLPPLALPALPRRMAQVPDGTANFGVKLPPVELPTLPENALSFGELHFRMIEQVAPPSVLVNQNLDIVHLSPNAGKWLQFAGGEVSIHLLKVVHPDLRLELRTSLFRALQHGENVDVPDITVGQNGTTSTVNLSVRPIQTEAGPFALVIFGPSQDTEGPKAPAPADHNSKRLEEELAHLKSQLSSSVEQFEVSTEELRASNEELQAINEELRSTGEELETSKEELQSVNEELITVNGELKSKVEEVSRANGDLQNFIASTDIATLFLNRELEIKRFTPRATDLFNLIPADLGRPLADLSRRLQNDSIVEDAEAVLRDLQPVERELQDGRGNWYLVRTVPYRTPQGGVDGVVLTFVDISRRKKAEDDLWQSARDLEQQARIFDTTLNNIADFAYIFDRQGRFVFSNQPLLDLLNISLEEIKGKNFFDLEYPPALAVRLHEQIEQVFGTGETIRDETPFEAPSGQSGFYEYIFKPVKNGEEVEWVSGSTRDITAHKRREANLAFLSEFQDDLSRSATTDEILQSGAKIGAFFQLATCNFQDVDEANGTITVFHSWAKPGARDVLGTFSIQDYASGWQEAARAGETIVVRDTQNDARTDANAYAERQIGAFIGMPFLRDGEWKFALSITDTGPRDWKTDEIELFREVAARLFLRLERARVEAELQKSADRLRLATEAAHIGTCDWDYERGEMHWNDIRFQMYGVEFQERAMHESDVTNCLHPDERDWVLPEIHRQIETRGEHSVEYRVLWPDDSVHVISEIGRVVERKNGQPTRVITVLFDITERKRTEEELRQSEERLRLATGAARMYGWEWDIASQTFHFSGDAAEILGVEGRLPFTVEDSVALTHPDDVEMVGAALKRAAEIGEDFALDFRSLKASGAALWLGVHATVVKDDSGTPIRILGVAQDITERKGAEEELRLANYRFEVAEAASRGFLYDWNIQTAIAERSQSMPIVLGWENSEIPTTPEAWADLIHPDDRFVVEEFQQKLAAGDVNIESEYRLRHKNGHYIHAYERALVLRDAGGKPQRIIGQTIDITARKAAENALRQSQERLQMVLESAEDYAIFTLDSEGVVNSWNSGAEATFGYHEDEILGQNTAILFTPEDRAAGEDRKEIETARRSGRAEDERWHIRQDGSRFFASGVLMALQGSSGFVKICRDMTKSRELHEQLRRAHDELEERVAQRTSELALANDELRHENAERKNAEAARGQLVRELENERGRLQDTLERMPAGVFIVTPPAGQVIFLNAQARALFGNPEWVKIDKLPGWKMLRPNGTPYKTRELPAMRALLKGEEVVGEEMQFRHDSRPPIFAAVNATPLRNAAGEIVGAIGAFQETTERRNAEKMRQQLLQRVVEVQEDERRRISRELHDQMGQSLTALMLGLKASDARPEGERLASLQSITGALMEQVHRLAWELRPAVLDNLGLEAALNQYVREWGKNIGLTVDFASRGLSAENRLPPPMEDALYRVVLEALTNVQRHAGASLVSVLVERADGVVLAIVEDNGAGFESATLETKRLGLVGMRERLELVNGELTIESRPGSGTTIYARVPVDRREAARD